MVHIREISDTILGSSVSDQKWILLNFLLPNILSSLLYIFDFACDSVLVYEHIIDNNYLFACGTAFIIVLPVLVSFVFAVTYPGNWPENKCTTFTKWLLLTVIKHLFFPVWAVWRFAEKIFWSIEACRFQSEFCLKNATRCDTAELYFFLQAYFQSPLQTILQLYILMNQSKIYRADTVYSQVFSIALSICTIAATSVNFQNYESNKVLGMQYPWSRTRGPFTYLSVNNPRLSQMIFDQIDTTAKSRASTGAQAAAHSVETLTSGSEDESQQSVYETPRRAIQSPTQYVARITKNKLLKPIEHGFQYTPHNIPLPKRKFADIARKQDDPLTRMILFLFWVTFELSRCLSIAVVMQFYPLGVLYTLLAHYALMAFMLLFNTRTRNINRVILYMFLSYVYTYAFIEFRVHFKHVIRTFVFFYVLVTSENLVFTFLWYLEDTIDSGSYWLNYVFTLIVFNMGMSAILLVVYVKVFKSEKVRLYMDSIRLETEIY